MDIATQWMHIIPKRRLKMTLDRKRNPEDLICLVLSLIRLILASQECNSPINSTSKQSPAKKMTMSYFRQRAILFRLVETYTSGFLNNSQTFNLFRISLDRRSLGLTKSTIVRYVLGNWKEENYRSDIALLQLRSDLGIKTKHKHKPTQTETQPKQTINKQKTNNEQSTQKYRFN
jgi:hypothetical protein